MRHHRHRAAGKAHQGAGRISAQLLRKLPGQHRIDRILALRAQHVQGHVGQQRAPVIARRHEGAIAVGHRDQLGVLGYLGALFSVRVTAAVLMLMVGNPGEDDHTVRDTTRMIEKVRPDFVSVSEAMVFPGTELYELAKQKGLVTDDYWLTDRPAPYFTIENNLEKLLEWSNIIMSANAGIIGKTLRRLRNRMEQSTGLRVTGEGIEYRKNGLVKRLVTWT